MKYTNKRGEGYILWCVLILAVCMILSVFLTLVNTVGIVKQTNRNARTVLDSYVMTNSIAVYNSVKQGNDTNGTLNSQSYTVGLKQFCTLVQKNDMCYYYDKDGSTVFYISVPSLGFTKDKSLKIYVSYTVYIPVYFSGVQVGTVTVPVKITSDFTEKF